MDQIQKAAMEEQKNNKNNKNMNMNKNKNTDQTLKKVTKLLFSLSLFSFLFALPIPTWLPFHLFHNSPNSRFHFLNQPIDKNSMFLLCNALLVFLANYSGLFKSLSSSSRSFDPCSRLYDFGPLSEPITTELVQKPPLIPTETPADEKNDDPDERIVSAPENGEEDESYGLAARFFAAESGEVEDTAAAAATEEEEEGNGGVLSDEELKRKFDEFIKRMKEEIVLDDATRTLVVV
ncbi:hypothetical protein SDJN03_14437, partial [Cucurbita argyrosperma subsp. sororia]